MAALPIDPLGTLLQQFNRIPPSIVTTLKLYSKSGRETVFHSTHRTLSNHLNLHRHLHHRCRVRQTTSNSEFWDPPAFLPCTTTTSGGCRRITNHSWVTSCCRCSCCCLSVSPKPSSTYYIEEGNVFNSTQKPPLHKQF